MPKASAQTSIRLRGVRQNNLKNFNLDLPLRKLVVVTGLSGSGKSSLAFDTLFAEGQRRYIETFSPYARQFLDRMDKPAVDSIEGIPPAIAIEQRNTVKSTRSTVGTMTEICDYTKMFWPHLARLCCKSCGKPVEKDSPQRIWTKVGQAARLAGEGEELPLSPGRRAACPTEVLVAFTIPLSEKLSLDESLALVARQGFQRLFIGDEIVHLDDALGRLKASKPSSLTVVQDRVKIAAANRTRFCDACEQAYHFGKGKLAIVPLGEATGRPFNGSTLHFSNRFHCADCDLEYREPTPALFSFNHPIGACPACRGFGRIITIDYDAAIPDRTKTLRGGAVKPWQTESNKECQDDMMRFAAKRKVPVDVPFAELPKQFQDWVIDGDPGYGTDEAHRWPRCWYGVKGYFRWLESKAYKMHVRVLLSRYRAYQTCSECHGTRFQPEALLYRLDVANRRLQIADFYRLAIRDALGVVDEIISQRGRKNGSARKKADPITLALDEVRSRLAYLEEVGLGYLTLDRATRSLSGGETERVNLTTCLGSRLVNTLFVLDEPSVGLHARDTARLVRIVERLRDAGNTVVVVEHEASVMRAADQIIDLGPGHGESGGEVVFQGSAEEILHAAQSLTGKYLSGEARIETPLRRAITSPAPTALKPARNGIAAGMPLEPAGKDACATLILRGANQNNLKNLTVEFPLGRFVCVTGVSGSGKTTLVREVLLPALEEKLKQVPQARLNRDINEDEQDEEESEISDRKSAVLVGWENISRVVLVDQSPLGKTPRSNPAVYIGAFEEIRNFFAASELAKQRGLGSSAFSFNSGQGQCERCRGAGFEKIEMQFLSDVFIRCPDCKGRRYRDHILEVKIQSPVAAESLAASNPRRPKVSTLNPQLSTSSWSIADLLEATVDEVIAFLKQFPESRPAMRAIESLTLLQDVGLGYLRLGQPINTLSGGESQRLKLVSHLAEAQVESGAPRDEANGKRANAGFSSSVTSARRTLFLFDEPTTGLHFDDVRVLLKVFQRLVDAGHTVLVIEHNLDVIRSADWLIDLGPEAGDGGGEIVAIGTPERVAACEKSYTGQALRGVIS